MRLRRAGKEALDCRPLRPPARAEASQTDREREIVFFLPTTLPTKSTNHAALRSTRNTGEEHRQRHPVGIGGLVDDDKGLVAFEQQSKGQPEQRGQRRRRA